MISVCFTSVLPYPPREIKSSFGQQSLMLFQTKMIVVVVVLLSHSKMHGEFDDTIV